jgi:uncharacterized protein YjlB
MTQEKKAAPGRLHGSRDTDPASDRVIRRYLLKDDGTFPNSSLPVLHYTNVLDIPVLFASWHVKRQFAKNGWTNAWAAGIFTYHHYHSNTHEVLGIIKGETTMCLGGKNGVKIDVKKGDVLILPAGVAHKNMREENAVVCVGAYPHGKDYDMNYGKEGERPNADSTIAMVTIPYKDPVFGLKKGIHEFWLTKPEEKTKPARSPLSAKKQSRPARQVRKKTS